MKINKKRVLRAFYSPATHLIPLVYRRCRLVESYGLPIKKPGEPSLIPLPDIYPVTHSSPLWNSVVICHLDLEKIVEIASQKYLGRAVTIEWLKTFTCDWENDPIDVKRFNNRAIKFWGHLLHFEKVLKEIEALKKALLDEVVCGEVDLAMMGGNHAEFDGTKVMIFHYPK